MRTRLLAALALAKQTVDKWVVGEDGRVHVHKDVISKAIDAAIYEANKEELE